METIALIAAMSSESAALLRLIPGWNRTAIGAFRAFCFRIADRDCTLVTSGMGIYRAAEATQSLLEALHPTYLFSFGIAGAVRDDLQIGDVIVATLNGTFENGGLSQLQPVIPLSQAAQEAARKALHHHGRRLVLGTDITTRGSQLLIKDSTGLVNPFLEMETIGILYAAAEKGVPLLVLRSVSDGPLAPIPIDLGSVMDNKYNFLPGRLFLEILKHPRLIFKSQQMIRNSRIAANHAAIAVLAALGQPGPLT